MMLLLNSVSSKSMVSCDVGMLENPYTKPNDRPFANCFIISMNRATVFERGDEVSLIALLCGKIDLYIVHVH